MKKLLFLGLILTAWTASAQNLFWSFNDEQQPMTIAPECDARFDEAAVAEDDTIAGLHGVNHRLKELRSSGHFLVHDATAHTLAFFDRAIHGERGKDPHVKLVFLIEGILDVECAIVIARDVHTKQILYLILHVIEGTLGDVLAAAFLA